MRKIFTLSLAALLVFSAQAQRLFTEDFNYPIGFLSNLAGSSNVSGGRWTNISGQSFFPLEVIAGNLSYDNYFTEPTANSNKVKLVNGTNADDSYASFTSQTSGKVYYSAIIRIVSLDNLGSNTSSGDYCLGLLPTTNTTSYKGRLYVRKGSVANTINLGVNVTSNSENSGINQPVYSSTNYPLNTNVIVTISYEFVAGASNDVSRLWINKTFSGIEPAPDAVSTVVSPNSEEADLGRIAIRQGGSQGVNCEIDAIAVATTYAASLPLSLTSFTGSLVNKAAQLNWTATNEVNVKGFAVEKGLNGKDFSEIAFVNAKNSDGIHEYSLEDINVKSGANYYRLKMVDKDGSARFSQVVLVNSVAGNSVTAFPNPAISNVNLSHEKANRGAVIRLVSLAGKVLNTYPVQAGATQTGVNVGQLVKGNYILVFENSGSKTVTQFTKQ